MRATREGNTELRTLVEIRRQASVVAKMAPSSVNWPSLAAMRVRSSGFSQITFPILWRLQLSLSVDTAVLSVCCVDNQYWSVMATPTWPSMFLLLSAGVVPAGTAATTAIPAAAAAAAPDITWCQGETVLSVSIINSRAMLATQILPNRQA